MTAADPHGAFRDVMRSAYSSWMRVPEYADPIRVRWYFIPRPTGIVLTDEYTSSNWDQDDSVADPPTGEQSSLRSPRADWADGTPPPWDLVCDCVNCPPGSPGTYYLTAPAIDVPASGVHAPGGVYTLHHVGPCSYYSDPFNAGTVSLQYRLTIAADRQVVTLSGPGGPPPSDETWARVGAWDCAASITLPQTGHTAPFPFPVDPVTIASKEDPDMSLIGEVIDFPAGPLPAGYLECNGQRVLQATYPKLFALWAFKFGPDLGDGTFQLVDRRGRVALGSGMGAGLSNYAVGDTGGEESHQLTVGETPAHAHTITDPGHTHAFTGIAHNHAVTDPGHVHAITDPTHNHGPAAPSAFFMTSGVAPNLANGPGTAVVFSTPTAAAATGISVNNNTTGLTVNNATAGGTNANATTGIAGTNNAGGGGFHENRQPYVASRFIVRGK